MDCTIKDLTIFSVFFFPMVITCLCVHAWMYTVCEVAWHIFFYASIKLGEDSFVLDYTISEVIIAGCDNLYSYMHTFILMSQLLYFEYRCIVDCLLLLFMYNTGMVKWVQYWLHEKAYVTTFSNLIPVKECQQHFTSIKSK